MAHIMPFRGTRFTQRAGALDDLVTLPYDRIEHGLQDEYYNRSEYNICRVIKGREFETDTPDDNVYTRSAAAWRDWLHSGIVAEDDEAAIYAYYQTFDVGGVEFTRRGFIAMVELQDYSSGGVKPHERTLEGPKADRLNLLKATHTHFGQIFQLYRDDDNTVADLLADYTAAQPLAEAGIPEQTRVTHRIWPVTDPTAISQLQEAMEGRPLFIADGHHRYETALNYRNYMLQDYTGTITGHDPRYAMMTMVGMSDPGLVVLPTHRVVHDVANFDIQRMLAGLGAWFSMQELQSFEQVEQHLAVAKSEHHNGYGLYWGGKFWYFELKDKTIMEQLCPDQGKAWRSLDVAVLHELVFERVLGISKEAQAAKANISYERVARQALEDVDDGTHQAVVFMNPTKLDQIRRVAGRGEVMPQKSTDFYPKLMTGLVSCQVDPGKKKN
jgi:uncharacterized protein (DUF1015 family)